MAGLPKEWPLYVDDHVAKKGDESLYASVVKTYADINTHTGRPRKSEMIRDKDVPKREYDKFLKTGIPPKGTVLVQWEDIERWKFELIPESKLVLIDRSILIGDVVRRNFNDALSGVVVSVFAKCTLLPIDRYTFAAPMNNSELNLLGIWPHAGFKLAPGKQPAPKLNDVPAMDLESTDDLINETLVIYEDWIGRVEHVSYYMSLKLVNNYVVEVPDEAAIHTSFLSGSVQVGDIVPTAKADLRLGNWIYGQHDTNVPPVGTVVSTRPRSAEISWLGRRYGSLDDTEPPSLLEREELESSSFQIYKHSKQPRGFVATDQPTVSNSELDVSTQGLRVRFKDLPAACRKYNKTNTNGHLSRIDRAKSAGYDLNVFDVIRTSTEVTVQWQDLSVTRHQSIDLLPDTGIDDEHAAWPGEIVHTLDLSPVPGMRGVQQPGKVGIVQSIQASERMASVKWCPSACLQYAIDEDDGESPRTLLSGVVGAAAGPEELISLYEVEAPGEINVRRGDIVLIADDTTKGLASAQRPNGTDWVGEIVDTGLDGLLTIRLGAANNVEDVKLRREQVIVVVRSDGTDQWDNWDDEGLADILDEDAAMFLEGLDGLPAAGDFDMRGLHDHSDDSSTEDSSDEEDGTDSEKYKAHYEDENGQPLDEEDVEDDEWESDVEDEGGEDVVMQDSDAAGALPAALTSACNPNDAQQNSALPDTALQAGPDVYAILDGQVPSNHPFVKHEFDPSAAHVKRTQREHKILRTAGALPQGVYIRTWETRLDLLRALYIGPAETPYADAPFVIDFWLPPTFPAEPPQAYFHSWPSDSGMGGVGRVNPNLYEDGKICLSILGTWEGSKGEGWMASRSTLLQVIVSILGLVLVREPYFNEAGYETLAGLESSKRPSALYSERIYLRSKVFVISALNRIGIGATSGTGGCEGLEDVIRWLYLDAAGPGLLKKTIESVQAVLDRSIDGTEADGLTRISKGACIPLRRILTTLQSLQR